MSKSSLNLVQARGDTPNKRQFYKTSYRQGSVSKKPEWKPSSNHYAIPDPDSGSKKKIPNDPTLIPDLSD